MNILKPIEMTAVKKFKKINFCTTFEPVVFISTIGGVCSIWKQSDGTSYEFSKKTSFFTGLILIINLCHLIFVPQSILYAQKKMVEHDFNISTDNLNSEHFITKMINPISISSVSLIFRFICLLKSHQVLPPIISSLIKIDNFLETDSHILQRSTVNIQILIFVIILLSWPFQIYSVQRILGNKVDYVLFGLNIYNNFSVFCCEFQFIVLAVSIGSRFKMLHLKLEKLSKYMKRHRNFEKHFNLSMLRDTQHLLFEVSSKLDAAFSLQLFLTLVDLGINSLLNLYFAIFGGFRSPATTEIITPTVSSVVNSVLWSMYYLTRFCGICFAADFLTRCANHTKIALSNVMCDCFDPNSKEELWKLLSYAVVRKIQFSALQFFNIDCSIITTAIATGATYLVILAQFHKG